MTSTSKNTLLGWSPLIGILFGIVGVFILPLVLWFVWKDEDSSMAQVGKHVVNAQLSWLIWFLLALPLSVTFMGFDVAHIFIGVTMTILWFAFTFITAIRITIGKTSYVMPFTIPFIR